MNKFEPQLSLSANECLSIFSQYDFYISENNKVIFYCQFSNEKEKDIIKPATEIDSSVEDFIEHIFKMYGFMPCLFDYISSDKDFLTEVKKKVDYERLHRIYTYSCMSCNEYGAGKDLQFHIDDTIKHFINENCPVCDKLGLHILM